MRELFCVLCGTPLSTSGRTDRRYCREACRVKAYRQRRRRSAEAEETSVGSADDTQPGPHKTTSPLARKVAHLSEALATAQRKLGDLEAESRALRHHAAALAERQELANRHLEAMAKELLRLKTAPSPRASAPSPPVAPPPPLANAVPAPPAPAAHSASAARTQPQPPPPTAAPAPSRSTTAESKLARSPMHPTVPPVPDDLPPLDLDLPPLDSPAPWNTTSSDAQGDTVPAWTHLSRAFTNALNQRVDRALTKMAASLTPLLGAGDDTEALRKLFDTKPPDILRFARAVARRIVCTPIRQRQTQEQQAALLLLIIRDVANPLPGQDLGDRRALSQVRARGPLVSTLILSYLFVDLADIETV